MISDQRHKCFVQFLHFFNQKGDVSFFNKTISVYPSNHLLRGSNGANSLLLCN